ncbi:MAG: hypothetical protein WCH99_22800 [Verrucomicrobiota bacterium]
MFTSSRSYYDAVASVQAQADANNAKSKAMESQAQVEVLRQDVERLLMISEALWSFLKKEHGYTDDQLVEKVTEIDLRDGQLDGKTTQPTAAPCPQCGRVNLARRPRCIYCGTALPVTLFAS